MASIPRLIMVFREARQLLARPNNDFSDSGWGNTTEALEEIEPLFDPLMRGSLERSDSMSFLFLPTGPLQQISLSSGWGDEFVNLANRFDAAMKATECACFNSHSRPGPAFHDLFRTQFHIDVSLAQCTTCSQNWCRLFYEQEAFSRSGRWYLGAITESQARHINKENAILTLEALEWYWYGGSYFDRVGISSGKIHL